MSNAPDFIQPPDIVIMSDEEFDTLLDRVRDSRLKAYRMYMEAEKEKQLIRDEKMRTKLAKQVEMLGKEEMRANKVIAALEKRMNTIRLIQLTLGDLDE